MDPSELLVIARDAEKRGDTKTLQDAMRRYTALTEPTQKAQDVSGQPPASAGVVATAGGAASGLDKRGGYGRRNTDVVPEEGSVPFSEWSGNVKDAALNVVPAMYRGAKQLVGGNVSEEDIKADRALTDKPGGGFGNFAGNIAMGGPAMAGTRAGLRYLGGKYLPKALEKATNLITSYPGMAAIEAGVTTPTLEDESRPGNMVTSALLTKGLQHVGTVFKRALTQPVKPNKDAQYLMATERALPQTDEDIANGVAPTIVPKDKIVPTQSQGGSGFMGAVTDSLENIGSYLPLGVSKAVQRGRDRVASEVNDEVGHRASPLRAIDVLPGRGDYVREMETQINDGYKAMFKGINIKHNSTAFNQQSEREGLQALDGIIGEAEFKNTFTKQLGQILPKKTSNLTGEQWHNIQSAVREKIREADAELFQRQSNHALANAYRKVEDNLKVLRNNNFTKDQIATLEDLDNKYLKGMIVKSTLAHKGETGADSAITLRNLIDTVEKDTPESFKNKLTGEFMDLTEPAKRILTKSTDPDAVARRSGYLAATNIIGSLGIGGAATGLGLAPAAMMLGAGHAAGRFLTGRGTNRYMFGDFDWQKKAAELLRKVGAVGDPAAAAVGGSTGERE